MEHSRQNSYTIGNCQNIWKNTGLWKTHTTPASQTSGPTGGNLPWCVMSTTWKCRTKKRKGWQSLLSTRKEYMEKKCQTREEKHTYVRMDLNYGTPGEAIVSIDSYITEAIDKFPEEMMKAIKHRKETTFLRFTRHVKNCVTETRSSSTGWWPSSSSSASVRGQTYNQKLRSSQREW